MLTLQVHEKNIEITEKEEFIRGTVGAKVKIDFDEFWQGYENTLVFKQHNKKPIKILVNNLSNILTIPYELLAKNSPFKIGAFGVKTDTVTPTLWSDNIKVRVGTDTNGTAPAEYTPSEIDQLRILKQDKLTAGDNIIINNNVISADVSDCIKKSDTTTTPTHNKIPKYDGNGSLSCSLAIIDESTGKKYVGGASPHTWVNDRINSLNKTMYDLVAGANSRTDRVSEASEKRDTELQEQIDNAHTKLEKQQEQIINSLTECNVLASIINAKKITSYQLAAGEMLELHTNALYLFLKDGSSNTCSIGLLNNETFTIFNSGSDDEIKLRFGLVLIPENTMGNSAEYPPSYYGIAVMDKTTLGVTTVSSKKFTAKKSDLVNGSKIVAKADSSGSFMIWELKL